MKDHKEEFDAVELASRAEGAARLAQSSDDGMRGPLRDLAKGLEQAAQAIKALDQRVKSLEGRD